MPKTLVLSGLTVAKSGTISLPEPVYKLLSFKVIRNSHVLSVEAGNDANAATYILGMSNHKLICSKAADSTAAAITTPTTNVETKTVINGGLVTSTIPSNDSVALSGAKTITIGNDNTDSLVGTETVVVQYVPKAEFPVPT